MTTRVNHRGWIVLESIPSSDGGLCVDFFEDPAGGFGFEHLRADPEDGGRWTAVGGFGGAIYSSAQLAADAALAGVSWLSSDMSAYRSWDRWKTETCPLTRHQDK